MDIVTQLPPEIAMIIYTRIPGTDEVEKTVIRKDDLPKPVEGEPSWSGMSPNPTITLERLV